MQCHQSQREILQRKVDYCGRQRVGLAIRKPLVTFPWAIRKRGKSWIIGIIVEYNTTYFPEQMVNLNDISNVNTNKKSKNTEDRGDDGSLQWWPSLAWLNTTKCLFQQAKIILIPTICMCCVPDTVIMFYNDDVS